MGLLYLAIPPNCRQPISRSLLPGCGLPLRPRLTTLSRLTPSVACGHASAVSARSPFSAAVSPLWMSPARSTTARRGSTCSPEAAPCPRVQVEAQKRYVPEHLTEDAVISHA